jgi:hypothetical protein
MVTKIKIITAVIFIYITAVFSTCKKGGFGCVESSISFNVDAKVYPDKDSINIGDTIFVEVNIPTTLIDQNNNSVDYSKANNLGTSMGFVKLVSDSPIVLDEALPDFNFDLISGKEISSPNVKLYKDYFFEESGGHYLFKLSIVPKKSGTFRFNLESATGGMRDGNTCPKAAFNFLLKNTTDQHYYLYPGGTGVTSAGADYYFYVR